MQRLQQIGIVDAEQFRRAGANLKPQALGLQRVDLVREFAAEMCAATKSLLAAPEQLATGLGSTDVPWGAGVARSYICAPD